MLLQRRRELGEGAEERCFRLFGVIGAHGADGGFVALRHVGVRVPEPFDGAGTLNERRRDFAFEESGFAFRRAAGDLVEIQLPLQAGFLDEHGFARLLAGEGIPQDLIVEPPGVVGGEVDGGAPEGGRESVLNAAFVLADGDELLRARGADGVAHGARPVGERLLREEEVVVQPERVRSGVHAAGGEFFFRGQRHHARYGAWRNIPQRGEFCAVGMALVQPLIPGSKFDGVAVGARLPQVL